VSPFLADEPHSLSCQEVACAFLASSGSVSFLVTLEVEKKFFEGLA
jgi:hypothetical protein